MLKGLFLQRFKKHRLQEWTNGVSHYELAVLFQAEPPSLVGGSMVHSMNVEADGPPEVCVVARPEAGTVENSICT